MDDTNKWKKPGDNLNYTIPDNANEELVELTTYQNKYNFSKRAQYRLKGKIVGERAWHRNGRIAYEMPIKNNMQHGIYRTWYCDYLLGRIDHRKWQIAPAKSRPLIWVAAQISDYKPQKVLPMSSV